MKNNIYGLLPVLAGVMLFPFQGYADQQVGLPPQGWQRTLILAHELSEFSLPLADEGFFISSKRYFYKGHEIRLNEDASCALDVEAETQLPIEPEVREEWRLNPEKTRQFLNEFVVPHVEREPTDVRIFRDENGEIAFEGVANFGKKIDFEKTLLTIDKALRSEVDRVQLTVDFAEPSVKVEADDLREMGVRELVSVGESDFSGSSWARIHNVETGASKFNGFLIPKGEVGSFNDRLGPVNGETGYLPELVILGPKLEKEYGGGLCQVSSTAFRAALLAGLPIVERYPHSFAVHYYEPWGTDATIYPGSKDMRFENNTDGAILMQTSVDIASRTLRFHYYGTRDKRNVVMFGPHIGYRSGPLTMRPTSAYPNNPGLIKYTSKAAAGFDATWLRVIIPDKDKSEAGETVVSSANKGDVSTFYSRYQPSVNWTTKPAPKPEEALAEVPAPASGSTI